MAIREFNLGPVAGLMAARIDDLPNLAVIAGPNGSGKSTLLYELWRQRGSIPEPSTRVTYLGPHRSWRKSKITGSDLSEFPRTFTQFLQAPATPRWTAHAPMAFQNFQQGVERDPRAQEEAFGFVKPSIVQLRERLQARLYDVWEAGGHEVRAGDVPDLLAPLRTLVRALLPHLDLKAIDASDPADLKVMFRRVDGAADDLVELDDLSSGEKAVVGLVLPIIETEAEKLLPGGETEEEGDVLPTALIDEPETHLHPTLQVLFVEQLAERAARAEGQFIIATQSPTIVDAIDDESLFLLAPAGVVPDENQLVPIGRSQQRVEVMRSLTGSTHLLTRCRPIVFLEGEHPAEKPTSDQRLVDLLIPAAQGWVLVAARGRSQAARAASELRAATTDALPGVPVFAIVDRDQSQHDDDDYVIPWPVAMIENLLLDPAAIWAVLEPHRESHGLTGSADADQRLREAARELEDDEVRLRVPALQRPVAIRIRALQADAVDDAIAEARNEFDVALRSLGDGVAIRDQFATARETVTTILDDGRELEAFRGKAILDRFFDQHAHSCGFSRKVFVYAVAREAAGLDRIQRLTAEAVRKIQRFVPSDAAPVLAAVCERLEAGAQRDALKDLATRLAGARDQWANDGEVEEDLEDLRTRVVALSRELPSEVVAYSDLTRIAAQLGVRSADPRSEATPSG